MPSRLTLSLRALRICSFLAAQLRICWHRAPSAGQPSEARPALGIAPRNGRLQNGVPAQLIPRSGDTPAASPQPSYLELAPHFCVDRPAAVQIASIGLDCSIFSHRTDRRGTGHTGFLPPGPAVVPGGSRARPADLPDRRPVRSPALPTTPALPHTPCPHAALAPLAAPRPYGPRPRPIVTPRQPRLAPQVSPADGQPVMHAARAVPGRPLSPVLLAYPGPPLERNSLALLALHFPVLRCQASPHPTRLCIRPGVFPPA